MIFAGNFLIKIVRKLKLKTCLFYIEIKRPVKTQTEKKKAVLCCRAGHDPVFSLIFGRQNKSRHRLKRIHLTHIIIPAKTYFERLRYNYSVFFLSERGSGGGCPAPTPLRTFPVGEKNI